MTARQLVTVSALGSVGVMTLWESGRTKPLLGPVGCFVGRNGITGCKREGDGCTPSGLFPLGFAFGTEAAADTGLTYRRLTPNSVWVDDPASPMYNTWAESSESPIWNSAERLWQHRREYVAAVTVEYNTAPVAPGLGSAIFIHCGVRETSGCIAAAETDVRKLLSLLDKNKAPCVLITKG